MRGLVPVSTAEHNKADMNPPLLMVMRGDVVVYVAFDMENGKQKVKWRCINIIRDWTEVSLSRN